MAKDELVDSHVSVSQCKKAVSALAKHASKLAKQREDTELLPGKEENVWLVLSVKKVTPEKKLKPYRMCVPTNFILLRYRSSRNPFLVH